MDKKITFLTCLLFLGAGPLWATQVLFNNAMSFDGHNFGLIDFEGSQTSFSGINSYLGDFGAQLADTGLTSGSISTGGSLAQPISSSHLLTGGAGSLGIAFDSPVQAVGSFLMGWEGGENVSPYNGDVAGNILVTSGNGQQQTYNYRDLLSPASPTSSVNGFFGVIDQEHGISEIIFAWNRDIAGIDNLYFGNQVDVLSSSGPTNVSFSSISSIPLPNQDPNASFASSDPTVPEASTVWLLLLGTVMIVLRKQRL